MRGLGGVVFVAFLAALAGAQEPPSPAPAGPAGRKVVRIRFEGNRRYTEDFLKEQVATKEGQLYDPGLIERDSQVLRQYFASVAGRASMGRCVA